MKKSTISPWSWVRLQVHRSIAKGGWYQFAFYAIIVAALIGILALCFSLTCDGSLWAIKDYTTDKPFAAAFYHLFTNGGENKLGGSQYGWLVTLISIVIVAILTSLFTNSLDKIAQRYLEGRTRYRIKHHVAIFGYHEMLPGLLKQMFDAGDEGRYFLIQTTQVEKARNELSRVLTSRQMNQVILQDGEIASEIDLPEMRVKEACELYIIGEEMMLRADSAHDTAVLKCFHNIAPLLLVPTDAKDKILCHVMFEHHSTFAVFQHSDPKDNILAKMTFLPFNYYEMWARKVFLDDSGSYMPLEGTVGIDKDSEDHVHLIVIGMSRMGIAMGLQAAHLAHYPNFIKHPERKTRITFIDRNARTEMYHLQGRMEALFQTAGWRYVEPAQDEYSYPISDIDGTPWHHPLTDKDSKSPYKSESNHLGKDFLDIEWEFIQADDENPAVQEYIRCMAEDSHKRLTVAVCVPDSHQAVAIGVNLPDAVYKSAVQVLIYQRTGDSIVQELSGSTNVGHTSYAKMHAFGMSSDGFNLDAVYKYAGKKYQKSSSSKSALANMWSNIYQLSHAWTKLRSAGSTDGTISEEDAIILGPTEHLRWNMEQLLTQFRPLTEAEQDAVLKGTATKNELKKDRLAHLDITAQERLKSVDPTVVQYDFEWFDKFKEFTEI